MSNLTVDIHRAGVWRRTLWGASWGALFGVACSILALVQFAIRGDEFEIRYHITFSHLVFLYLFACSLGGVVLGLVLPLARWKVGSMILGVLVVVPIGLVIQYSSLAGSPWSAGDAFVVIVGALMIGVPAGAVYYEMFKSSLQRRD